MRKVTDEERKVILEHPELVMFNTRNNNRDFAGSITMFAIPALIAVFGPIPLCFTSFAENHSGLIVILSLLWVILVIGVSVPVIMRYSNWRTKKDNGEYNINILRKSLPKELVCNVVTIKYVVPQQCEGAYIEDGKEQLFGYSGYRNYIPLTAGSEVAVIRDNEGFFAFVKRDEVTESLYREA